MPRELWTKAGELGLLSCMVPEEYGGLGLDCKYPAIMWEEQSYSGCTGPGFAMHSDIVAPCALSIRWQLSCVDRNNDPH